MSRHTVIIERAGGNMSAFVPDLPGCVATGRTEEEIRARIAEARQPAPGIATQTRRTRTSAVRYSGRRRSGLKFPAFWDAPGALPMPTSLTTDQSPRSRLRIADEALVQAALGSVQARSSTRNANPSPPSLGSFE